MVLIIMIYKLLSFAQRTIFWHFVCVFKTKNSNVNKYWFLILVHARLYV